MATNVSETPNITISYDDLLDNFYDLYYEYIADYPGSIENLKRKPWKRGDDHFFPTVAVYGVAFVLGLIGNTLVIFAIASERRKRHVTYLLIASLAVADALFLALCAPLQTLQYFLLNWELGGKVCKFVGFVETWTAYAAIGHLIIITVERYVVIVHPFRSRVMFTTRRIRVLLLATWLTSAVLATPAAYVRGIHTNKFRVNGTGTIITFIDCLPDGGLQHDPEGQTAYAWFQLSIMFLIPSVIMTICYAKVVMVLWSSARDLQLLTLNSVTRDQKHSSMVSANSNASRLSPQQSVISRGGAHEAKDARKQVIKMLIAVVVVFMLCWGPKLIIFTLTRHGLHWLFFSTHGRNAKIACNLLPYCQSALNPLIYGFMSANFRSLLKRAFQSCCRCRSSSTQRFPEPSKRSDYTLTSLPDVTQGTRRISDTRGSYVPVLDKITDQDVL